MKNLFSRSAVLLLVLAGGGSGPARAGVVINEILAQPARDWDGDGLVHERGDEWVEVYNNDTREVDLGEYYLGGAEGGTPHLRLTGRLAAGRTAVFFGAQALAWQQQQNLDGVGLDLADGGGSVQLLKAAADPALPLLPVDWVTLTADHCAADRSVGWDTDGGVWMVFDGLNPCGADQPVAGSGCVPTPASLNHCFTQLAAEPLALGDLKARFR